MSVACPVCTVSLSDVDDRPSDWVPCVLNPCAHIVCLGCTQMIQKKQCPVCRDLYTSVLPLVHLVSNNSDAVEAVRAWRVAEKEEDVQPAEAAPKQTEYVSRTARMFSFPANTRRDHVDILFESRRRLDHVRLDRLLRKSISDSREAR